MFVLDKVFLTASARPVLLPGELERLLVDKASCSVNWRLQLPACSKSCVDTWGCTGTDTVPE